MMKKTALNIEEKEIETGKKELNTEYYLKCAEYYMYEAVTCVLPAQLHEKLDVTSKLYYDLKSTATGDVSESVRNLEEMTLKNMCELHRVIIEETKKHLKMKEDLFALARDICQYAIDAAVTSNDLTKCARAIEIQLDDKEWADQIFKRAAIIAEKK